MLKAMVCLGTPAQVARLRDEEQAALALQPHFRGFLARRRSQEGPAGAARGMSPLAPQQQQQQQQQVWGFVVKSLSIYSMHHARYCLATGNSLCCYPQQQQQQQQQSQGGFAGNQSNPANYPLCFALTP